MVKYQRRKNEEASSVPKDFLRFSDFIPFSGIDNYYQRNTGRNPIYMDEGISDRFLNGDDEKMTPRARKNINLLENINAGYAIGAMWTIMAGGITGLAMLTVGLEK